MTKEDKYRLILRQTAWRLREMSDEISEALTAKRGRKPNGTKPKTSKKEK